MGESGTHKTQEEKEAIVRKLSQFTERGDKWVENRARKRNYQDKRDVQLALQQWIKETY